MAKYTYEYACGHGSAEVQLYGKNSDRERKLEWYAQNMVCKDCFKKQKLEQDATAPQELRLTLACKPDEVTLQLEARGNIEANKPALTELGYKWRRAQSGLLGMLSTKDPGMVLCVQQTCRSLDQALQWIAETSAATCALGYELVNGLSVFDMEQLQRVFAQMAEHDALLAKIEAEDPRPKPSALRLRIAALEQETGSKWNGRFYGRKGSWSFYVNNTKYEASDKEVSDRQQMLRDLELWKERHPELEK